MRGIIIILVILAGAVALLTLIEPKPIVNNRYFHVSYCYDNGEKEHVGDYCLRYPNFPNRHYLDSLTEVNMKEKKLFYKDIIYTSFFEFTSKTDFDNYVK